MTDATEVQEAETANILEIKQMIPHRYPFLLIDKVKDIYRNKSAVGVKNVTINEPFFQGHFPDKPVMPGVLIVEALAQTSAVLVIKTLDKGENDLLVYFMTLDKTKFRRVVEPGDVLELKVDIIRGRGKIWKFWGEASVNGELAAECEFSAMIVDPKAS